MPQPFNCPTCGAPLNYKGGSDLTINCSFCGTPVIVPPELRTGPIVEPPVPTSAAPLTVGQRPEFAEIERLVRDGKKIEAIKLFRELTGAGLKESKDAVERLAAGRTVEIANYAIVLDQPNLTPADAGQAEKIRRMGQLLQAGNKIEAIKIYREVFGVGLKEAKDAVERLETTVGTPGAFDLHPPEVTPMTARRAPLRTVSNVEPSGASSRGCLIAVGLLIIAALAVWLALGFNSGDNRIAAFFRTLSPTETAVPTRVLPATEAPAPTPAPTDTPAPSATPRFAEASILVGDRGTLPGQFNDARHIGLDGAGNIYVGEYVGGRIQVFDESGAFVTQWRVGDENGFVRHMAVSPEGIVFAVYNGNILKYEGMTGNLLGQIDYDGGQGFQDVAATANGGLAASWNRDWQGGLFVNFNESQDDIVIFDADGNVVNVIGKALSEVASGNAELDTSVAVDGSGNIYASGSLNSGIFKFSPDGKFLDKFGQDRTDFVRAMAVDFQGRLFASASGEILIFDAEGRYLDSIDASPGDMVFNGSDVLYTIDDPQVIRYVLNR